VLITRSHLRTRSTRSSSSAASATFATHRFRDPRLEVRAVPSVATRSKPSPASAATAGSGLVRRELRETRSLTWRGRPRLAPAFASAVGRSRRWPTSPVDRISGQHRSARKARERQHGGLHSPAWPRHRQVGSRASSGGRHLRRRD
jgi:hypothetical protein